MAEADIAYVATAGAAGLALGVSAWALRLRARLSAAAAAAERDRDAAQADLSRHDSMLRAFDDVSLALTGRRRGERRAHRPGRTDRPTDRLGRRRGVGHGPRRGGRGHTDAAEVEPCGFDRRPGRGRKGVRELDRSRRRRALARRRPGRRRGGLAAPVAGVAGGPDRSRCDRERPVSAGRRLADSDLDRGRRRTTGLGQPRLADRDRRPDGG
jgi:hypothetical protein